MRYQNGLSGRKADDESLMPGSIRVVRENSFHHATALNLNIAEALLECTPQDIVRSTAGCGLRVSNRIARRAVEYRLLRISVVTDYTNEEHNQQSRCPRLTRASTGSLAIFSNLTSYIRLITRLLQTHRTNMRGARATISTRNHLVRHSIARQRPAHPNFKYFDMAKDTAPAFGRFNEPESAVVLPLD